mmetsp:Transcript_6619/g.17202  ORF Transcript_6619/g.17202 Transcript_6619/m.17202 type:complete len:472 (-) Transcript_6619:698-2113(-)
MPATAMSAASAAFTVFACTISGGLLALPAVFSSVTLVPALLLTLLGAFTTFCSLLALAAVQEMHNSVTSYGKLLRFCCGDAAFAELIMDGIIATLLTGVMGGTFIVIHDFFLQELSNTWHADAATCGAAVLVLLLALPAQLGPVIARAATLSVSSFCFLVLVLIYCGASELTSGSANGTDVAPEWWPAVDSPPSTVFKGLPVVVYAFGCQFQLLDIVLSFGGGAAPGLRRLVPVIAAAVTMMIAAFSLTGVFGVLAFPGQEIAGDVLTMLETKGPLGNAARGLLVVACTLSCPLLLHTARMSAASFARGCSRRRRLPRPSDNEACEVLRVRLFGAFLVSCSTALALSGLDFLLVVGAMGAFLCAPLFYVLPGVALLRGLRRKPRAVASIQTAPGGQFDGSHEHAAHNALLNPLVGDDAMPVEQSLVLHPMPIEGRAWGRCMLTLMAGGIWLVGFGTITTGLSVWGYLVQAG